MNLVEQAFYTFIYLLLSYLRPEVSPRKPCYVGSHIYTPSGEKYFFMLTLSGHQGEALKKRWYGQPRRSNPANRRRRLSK